MSLKRIMQQITDEILECPLCMDSYKDPRNLACPHSFCLPCIQKVEQQQHSEKSGALQCPLCREKTPVPHGAEGLTKNILLQQLHDIVHTHTASTKPRPLCRIHQGSELNLFCHGCNIAICATCFDSHGKHQVTSFKKAMEVYKTKHSFTQQLLAVKAGVPNQNLYNLKTLVKESDMLEQELGKINRAMLEVIHRSYESAIQDVSIHREVLQEQIEAINTNKSKIESLRTCLDKVCEEDETTDMDAVISSAALEERAKNLLRKAEMSCNMEQIHLQRAFDVQVFKLAVDSLFQLQKTKLVCSKCSLNAPLCPDCRKCASCSGDLGKPGDKLTNCLECGKCTPCQKGSISCDFCGEKPTCVKCGGEKLVCPACKKCRSCRMSMRFSDNCPKCFKCIECEKQTNFCMNCKKCNGCSGDIVHVKKNQRVFYYCEECSLVC